MPSTVLWFNTRAFVDSEADREARINEAIGGAALAKALSSDLRAAGLAASEPWAEDHGWDFDVSVGKGVYLIVCSIEEFSPDDEARDACVQVHLGRPSQATLPASDPVLTAIQSALTARGETATPE